VSATDGVLTWLIAIEREGLKLLDL